MDHPTDSSSGSSEVAPASSEATPEPTPLMSRVKNLWGPPGSAAVVEAPTTSPSYLARNAPGGTDEESMFPWFAPILQAKAVADRTLDAILREEIEVVIPHRLLFLHRLISLFPPKATKLMQRFMGCTVAPHSASPASSNVAAPSPFG